MTGYGAEVFCDELVRTLAEGGVDWKREPADLHLDVVCGLSAPEGASAATVRDSGLALKGDDICAGLVAQGWTD